MSESSPPLQYRVESISVEGYRAFREKFTLDIPVPEVQGHPDVIMLGSINGVGKTSLLEALLWGGLAAAYPGIGSIAESMEKHMGRRRPGFPALESLCRSDAQIADISVQLSVPGEDGQQVCKLRISLDRQGNVSRQHEGGPVLLSTDDPTGVMARRAMEYLLRPGVEPVVIPGMVYFSSYRRVYEGNINPEIHGQRARTALGLHSFKIVAYDLIMWKKNVFYRPDHGEDQRMDRAYETLNDLLGTFAGVRLGEQIMRVRGHEQPLVTPLHGGESFPIDHLSSGQKEIISTLYLVWDRTRDIPQVILIDEPELYLNQEWHRHFMRKLFELAPDNQYILATHSEEIARQIGTSRLRILRGEQ